MGCFGLWDGFLKLRGVRSWPAFHFLTPSYRNRQSLFLSRRSMSAGMMISRGEAAALRTTCRQVGRSFFRESATANAAQTRSESVSWCLNCYSGARS